MTGRLNRNASIYGDYVEGQVVAIAKRGGGAFTFKEIAKAFGLSPNHNLRKRLRTLEALGSLTISYGLVGKCGTCLIYQIDDRSPEAMARLDIPF